jgi:hypothetical protein
MISFLSDNSNDDRRQESGTHNWRQFAIKIKCTPYSVPNYQFIAYQPMRDVSDTITDCSCKEGNTNLELTPFLTVLHDYCGPCLYYKSRCSHKF